MASLSHRDRNLIDIIESRCIPPLGVPCLGENKRRGGLFVRCFDVGLFKDDIGDVVFALRFREVAAGGGPGWACGARFAVVFPPFARQRRCRGSGRSHGGL